jgi:hypothetical protein
MSQSKARISKYDQNMKNVGHPFMKSGLLNQARAYNLDQSPDLRARFIRVSKHMANVSISRHCLVNASQLFLADQVAILEADTVLQSSTVLDARALEQSILSDCPQALPPWQM